MSLRGATRTFRNIRYPVAMGWKGVVTLLKIGRGTVGIRSNSHAAATTSRHACMADALKARCVLADVRWRWTVKVLYVAASVERNLCADPTLLNPCIASFVEAPPKPPVRARPPRVARLWQKRQPNLRTPFYSLFLVRGRVCLFAADAGAIRDYSPGGEARGHWGEPSKISESYIRRL
jgi:hypothetical protein